MTRWGRIIRVAVAAGTVVAVYGCQPGGQVAHVQAIDHALVSHKGRVVKVAASWCGVDRLTLTAAQSRTVVRLRAVGYFWPGSGVACPPDTPRAHATTRLRAPLGGRAGRRRHGPPSSLHRGGQSGAHRLLVEDEIGWHSGGYALIVKSRSLAAGRRPFGPAVLERVAVSLSAPWEKQMEHAP